MASLPPLPTVDRLDDLHEPIPKIKTDEDVLVWKSTSGFQNYALFIQRLNEAVVGRTLQLQEHPSEAIIKLNDILSELDHWIEDIPPRPTPQRFGNLAFRDWGKRLEERAESLVVALLPEHQAVAAPLLVPYLINSFGSFLRIDYGSGHELCFAIFLYCLTFLRYFQPEPSEERQLVCNVFQKYLKVVWHLQDTYKLEPAGSHGVWGLDDYNFLPYIWGSAQLRTISDAIPIDILRQPRPATNLYDISISRIHQLKTGPFHEHSPQLHSIATTVPNWAKVNSGLFKMYDAEVLGKRVVVQHVPLGGLMPWDPTTDNSPSSLLTGTPARWTAVTSAAQATATPPSLLPTLTPRSRPAPGQGPLGLLRSGGFPAARPRQTTTERLPGLMGPPPDPLPKP